MRRAFLLTGLAVGAVLFTSVSYAHVQAKKVETVQHFREKLADLTFCRTGYDIASSRPHYVSRFATDPVDKDRLLKESDELAARKVQLDRMIADHLALAKRLPLDEHERAILVEQVQYQAEIQAVHTAGWVDEPNDFIDHLAERCEPYLTE